MYGIFTYIYHKNQLNVGKYPSPMDPMGMNPFLHNPLGNQEPLQETNIHIPPTFGSLELEKSTQKGQKPNLWMWCGIPGGKKSFTDLQISSGWWFQPLWNMLVKLDHLPQFSGWK